MIAVLMTLVCSEMLKRNLAIYVNWFLAGSLLVGTLMQCKSLLLKCYYFCVL